jgi:hypothetical protein
VRIGRRIFLDAAHLDHWINDHSEPRRRREDGTNVNRF